MKTILLFLLVGLCFAAAIQKPDFKKKRNNDASSNSKPDDQINEKSTQIPKARKHLRNVLRNPEPNTKATRIANKPLRQKKQSARREAKNNENVKRDNYWSEYYYNSDNYYYYQPESNYYDNYEYSEWDCSWEGYAAGYDDGFVDGNIEGFAVGYPKGFYDPKFSDYWYDWDNDYYYYDDNNFDYNSYMKKRSETADGQNEKVNEKIEQTENPSI